jgi:hypothetical protein
MLLAVVLLINPLLRWIRIIRPLSSAELLTVFAMVAVAASLATTGLASRLIPAITTVHNRDWNTRQSQWDIYVEPYIPDAYLLTAKGTQNAAREYRETYLRLQELKTVYAWAQSVTQAKEEARKAEEDWRQAKQLPSDADTAARLSHAQWRRETAKREAERADILWSPYRKTHSLDSVLTEYPARIAAAETALQKAEQTLRALENEAAAKVSVFRQGLPTNLRAMPGFLKSEDESWSDYFARFQRFRQVRRAQNSLHDAQRILTSSSAEPRSIAASIDKILADLSRVNDTAAQEQKQLLLASEQALTGQFSAANEEAQQLRRQQRQFISARERQRIERQLAACNRRVSRLEREMDDIRQEQKRVEVQTSCVAQTKRVETAVRQLREGLNGKESPDRRQEILALNQVAQQFEELDVSLPRYIAGDVPWRQWLRPLAHWAILIVLTYAIMLALNVLLFRQWAHHENLIYPLVELTELLAGAQRQDAASEKGPSSEGVPSLYRQGLLWTGAAVVILIEGWNLLVQTNVIPGLAPIRLIMFWPFYDSVFVSIHYDSKWEILFTMVGISFLLPVHVSFSLWLFAWVFMIQSVIRSGFLGYPPPWGYDLLFETSFRYAEGGGAMLVFAAVILWKCRKYLVCAFYPAAVSSLESDERAELRVASGVFFLASAALILALWQDMGAHLGYTVFVWFVLVLLTVGMSRVMAEGGIIVFKNLFSPFHFIRNVFGMDKAWNAPALWAPLVYYYGVFFLFIKPFIAPAMANAVKIKDDLRLPWFRFYGALALGMAIAATVAILTHLVLAYDRGGIMMYKPTYESSNVPNMIADVGKRLPEPSAANSIWIGVGGSAMAALLFLRRSLFWLPHPIGLAMLCNPFTEFWFSIFLGWLCKRLVVKYGNRDVYFKVRNFFIGLILGEIIAYVIGNTLGFILGRPLNVELHRMFGG